MADRQTDELNTEVDIDMDEYQTYWRRLIDRQTDQYIDL